MSHFIVLVTGDDVEGDLEKYDENLEVKPYLVTDDQEEIEMEVVRAEAYYKELDQKEGKKPDSVWQIYGMKRLSNVIQAKLYLLNEYNGYESFRIRKDQIQELSTSNPDGHWDWWTVGGRWNGYFDVKPDTKAELPNPHYSEVAENDEYGFKFFNSRRVDEGKQPITFEDWVAQADPSRYPYKTMEDYYAANRNKSDSPLVKDIDFEWGRKRVTAEANDLFDKYDEATKGLTPKSWEETRERHGKEHTQEARDEYHADPWVKATRKLTWSPDIFLVGREKYVEEKLRYMYVPYSFVHKGEWISKGTMGWFGMSSDDVTDEAWATKVQEFFATLPLDTRITAVDCHV